MNGWIKIPRNIIHTPIFKNGDLVRLLVWLNAKAVFKAQTVAVGLQDVELLPGQMLYGVNKAVEELDIPKTTVRRYMKRLEQQGYISIQAGPKYSIVDLKRTSNGPQMDTYKKEKKEKRENKEKQEKEKPAKTAGRKRANKFINYQDEHTDFSDFEHYLLEKRRKEKSSKTD